MTHANHDNMVALSRAMDLAARITTDRILERGEEFVSVFLEEPRRLAAQSILDLTDVIHDLRLLPWYDMDLDLQDRERARETTLQRTHEYVKARVSA